MATATENNFSAWRGYRSTYNALGAAGKLNYWTLYSVIEPDGSRNLYWGAKPTVVATGELRPVIDIVETLPTTLNVGDRYIVGHDGTFDDDGNVVTKASYYVVEIAADFKQSVINPLGDFSARVKNRSMKCYTVVNEKIRTYDGIIDCGEY